MQIKWLKQGDRILFLSKIGKYFLIISVDHMWSYVAISGDKNIVLKEQEMVDKYHGFWDRSTENVECHCNKHFRYNWCFSNSLKQFGTTFEWQRYPQRHPFTSEDGLILRGLFGILEVG